MLKPGDTIGILGGGQLARMLAIAAAQLGLKTHIYCPDAQSPAFDVSAAHTIAPYENEADLARFAGSVDAVTFEFENVPQQTLRFLAAFKPVAPSAEALAITQDRLAEKEFMRAQGVEPAPFHAVATLADLEAGIAALKLPAILKTRRFGYDGKGQVRINARSEAEAAWASLGRVPAILEGFIAFEREVSVVAARGHDGAFAAFSVTENEHRHHILTVSKVPAVIRPETEALALDHARRLGEGLGYVGVFALELFVCRSDDGRENLIGNEIAPRVHNSGHWTLDGATTSQFEQHIRAVAGWPLGDCARRGRVEMRNLIGQDAADWRDILGDGTAKLHLYGKSEIRAGRKMGHVTRILPE